MSNEIKATIGNSNKRRITKNLKKLSKLLREDILDMAVLAKEGHIASAFSCVDILATLYFNIMNIKPDYPEWENRDRFILSKGHACAALYAVLARREFFPVNELTTIKQTNSRFSGHPDKDKVCGVDVSTGSLGHGLSIGVGMALAAKRDNKDYRIFVLLGDGECQEGSIWEAAMFAAMHKLDNLIAIVDYNKQQATGFVEDIVELKPFIDKWMAFGWDAKEVKGHDYKGLLEIFSNVPFRKNSPSVIIANTTKGKGVSFMEREIMWHARATTKEEYKRAVEEIFKNEKEK